MKDFKIKAFDQNFLQKCDGYNPDFIQQGLKLSLFRILPTKLKVALPVIKGNKTGILNYTGFSVLYNCNRRMPFSVAYTINGAETPNRSSRPEFHQDPRIDSKVQLSKDGFYALRKNSFPCFEVGHMASNNELGRGKLGKLKAWQTFHFPNTAPQIKKLNAGLWRSLETYVIKESASLSGNKKISVFTGPVLSKNDPLFVLDQQFKIPLLFYKVIVFPSRKGIHMTAFIMSQERKLFEDGLVQTSKKMRGPALISSLSFRDFTYRKVFQVNVEMVEELTGLNFNWKNISRILVPGRKQQLKTIRETRDAADAKKEIVNKLRGNELSAIKTTKLNMILP